MKNKDIINFLCFYPENDEIYVQNDNKNYLSILSVGFDFNLKRVFLKAVRLLNKKFSLEDIIKNTSALVFHLNEETNSDKMFSSIYPKSAITYEWITQTIGEQIWIFILFESEEEKINFEKCIDKKLLHPYVLKEEIFKNYKLFSEYTK